LALCVRRLITDPVLMIRAHGDRAPPSPITVVVVDDHSILRELIAAHLREAGFHVVATAGSLAAGEQAVAEHQPHVLVLDDQLPDGAGVGLCRALTRRMPHLRVVIHSTVVTPWDRAEAFAAGAVDVVLKAITIELLTAAIVAGVAAPQHTDDNPSNRGH
jgi:DNA-binding NarL/FixJ family response regulator